MIVGDIQYGAAQEAAAAHAQCGFAWKGVQEPLTARHTKTTAADAIQSPYEVPIHGEKIGFD
jgi:hypothetical protein